MSSDRDFVMARLAAARSLSQDALDAIDEAIAVFVDPGDDKDGEDRIAAIDAADEFLGRASRVIQKASEVAEEVIADWQVSELDDEDESEEKGEDSEEDS